MHLQLSSIDWVPLHVLIYGMVCETYKIYVATISDYTPVNVCKEGLVYEALTESEKGAASSEGVSYELDGFYQGQFQDGTFHGHS